MRFDVIGCDLFPLLTLLRSLSCAASSSWWLVDRSKRDSGLECVALPAEPSSVLPLDEPIRAACSVNSFASADSRWRE